MGKSDTDALKLHVSDTSFWYIGHRFLVVQQSGGKGVSLQSCQSLKERGELQYPRKVGWRLISYAIADPCNAIRY